MKTTIKIHDAKWFKKHCRNVDSIYPWKRLQPKYAPWKNVQTVHWPHGDTPMASLAGKIVEVQCDLGNDFGDINKSRYKVAGYWIPNWAIEWVKEEE